MEEEIWKDIPDFEGLYQISSLGRVKSLKREVPRSGKTLKVKGRILKPSKEGGGYFQVFLTKKGIKTTLKIHKIVAIVFLNHTPCGYKKVINHKNFIRTDNRVDNLEIVTARENGNKKHLKSKSKYVGVCWHKQRGKWSASIYYKRKTIRLGLFEKEIEAHKAYQNALNAIINNYKHERIF